MIEALDQDLRVAPNAFDWRGSTEVARVRQWLESHGHAAPDDLVSLWAMTGGGDMFETEEILAPTGVGDHDLEAVNRRLWDSGLSERLLVFHSGLHLTAIDPNRRIIRIDPDSLEPTGSFSSLSAWYGDLRREYARTYGLDSPEA
jgi:hypothetical protein